MSSARTEDSACLGANKMENEKRKSKSSARSLLAKSRQKMNTTKSMHSNIHDDVTKVLNAAAKSATPKRNKYVLFRKRHKFSFQKTPERRPKRFNVGHPEKVPDISDSNGNRHDHKQCRTPTTKTSLNTTTPPSKRKLLSMQQYFMGVDEEKQRSVSSAHEESITGAVSNTSCNLFPQRKYRSTSSDMVYDFPASPSKYPATRKNDRKILQKMILSKEFVQEIEDAALK
ncbi:uncharacterized protein LOC121384727 [Gigantopelta aegis]|uniref:uncharacterized protein LOC121384727 n=1 Tax=Gigantopelta aegis TaxID=1735272 RepID=UPI001B88D6B6|nr:uncharacterized protein LOC121384727 [Gigantopelta aegis]